MKRPKLAILLAIVMLLHVGAWWFVEPYRYRLALLLPKKVLSLVAETMQIRHIEDVPQAAAVLSLVTGLAILIFGGGVAAFVGWRRRRSGP